MGLRGTLGYNMNILTALVELLVKKNDAFTWYKYLPFTAIVLIDFLLRLPQ
jgi:hypothetical protein